MIYSNENVGNCNEALEDFASFLDGGGISESEVVALKMKFPKCNGILQEQYVLWKDLVDIDVPEVSNHLHSRFYGTLTEFNEAEGNKDSQTFIPPQVKITTLWSNPWSWAIAASILAIGILIGRTWSIGTGGQEYAIEEANSAGEILSYVGQVKQYSATQKLIAIQEFKKETQPSEKVIDVLYQVLLNDPSINVRLTSIETLIHFADQPRAREYLLRAIPYQESALIQVALADAMLFLQERKSADAWKEILKSPNVEPDVKIHIAETLESLL